MLPPGPRPPGRPPPTGLLPAVRGDGPRPSGPGRHTGRVTTAARQTRRGPGRPCLPLDRIVATALRIVDEQGADALSMRSLAQALDSGTATLYRHFANRAELIAQVVDRVFG